MAKPNGPVTCLALGEPWCTDVVRGFPVMARLAEETGIDLKIFFRDENLDIMNEFLYKGEYQSIPVFVFYSKDHEYLGHWIERSKKAREEIKTLLNPLTTKLRDPTSPTRSARSTWRSTPTSRTARSGTTGARPRSPRSASSSKKHVK